MRLPNFRRLLKQDYEKEFAKLIDTLAGSLNYGVEVLYQALNRNLTLYDNMKTTLREVQIQVGSDGIPTSDTFMLLDFNDKVIGTQILSVDNLTDPTVYPVSGPFISFTQEGRTLKINHITGLQPGNTYSVRIVAHV